MCGFDRNRVDEDPEDDEAEPDFEDEAAAEEYRQRKVRRACVAISPSSIDAQQSSSALQNGFCCVLTSPIAVLCCIEECQDLPTLHAQLRGLTENKAANLAAFYAAHGCIKQLPIYSS